MEDQKKTCNCPSYYGSLAHHIVYSLFWLGFWAIMVLPWSGLFRGN